MLRAPLEGGGGGGAGTGDCPRREAQVFNVTNNADDGSVGSLRWAIGQANVASPGQHSLSISADDHAHHGSCRR